MDTADHGLENLLAYDGLVLLLEGGYWMRFVIRRVPSSRHKPYGIDYALTLHDGSNERIFGFDNDHAVDHTGNRFVAAPVAFDHCHRRRGDPGRPYLFIDAAQLIQDFFDGVERILSEKGLNLNVIEQRGQQ